MAGWWRARAALFVVFGTARSDAAAVARAVAGVARTVLLERVSGLAEADLSREELLGAGEIIAANAVRGAVPITRLESRPVGDGKPGPWARRLAEALADD